MAQPTPYTRQKIWGTDPVVGEDVDIEFDAIRQTLDETLTNIEILQRDDTDLANGIVTPESLSAQTLALIGGGWNPRGIWAIATAYAVNDLVTNAGVSYLCVTAHTSTGSFSNDYDSGAGYWLLLRAAQVQTTDIDDEAVTYAKIQDVTTDRLLGRDTAGAGIVEELTVGGGLEFSGTGGIQRSALTGAVTASAASGVTSLSNDVVTTTKILDLNVTAAKLAADAVETAKIKDLNVTAGKLAANAVTTSKILDGQVTKAKVENVAISKLLGRGGAAGAGPPVEISLGARLTLAATTLNVEDPGWTVITAADPSGVAALDFTSTIGSTYDCYALVGRLIPATDNRILYLRVSTDGGSSYKSGGSDYGWVVIGGYATGASTMTAEDSGSSTASEIKLTGAGAAGIGNATNEGCEFTIYFHAPSSTAVHKRFNGTVSGLDASGNPFIASFAGVYKATTAINAVRLLFQSGNIASGHVTLYGIKKA